MLLVFTIMVLALFLLSSVGILLLCEHVLRYPKGYQKIKSIMASTKSRTDGQFEA